MVNDPTSGTYGTDRRKLLKRTATLLATLPFAAGDSVEGAKTASGLSRLNPWRLEPVDLRRFMRLGVEHIYQGAVDRRRGCLPFVRFNLTDPPTWARHEYWGSPHMVGRFLDALAVTAGIVDVPGDEEVVAGLRTLLHGSLDNQWGLPFDTEPGPDGKRTACMHHCREVLLGLVGLWQWRQCDRSAALARKLVRTIEQVTRPSGSFPALTLRHDGWTSPQSGETNMTTGRLIGALAVYYRASKDETAIVLAHRFAKVNLKETFTSEGGLTSGAGTHLHSTEGTMTALLDLGLLTGEDRYLQIARQLYDRGLRGWRTSFGWAKESRDDSRGRGEANNTGDFVEVALLLAQAGHPEYFRDVERFLRNGLLASQIVATDWIAQSSQIDTRDYVYSDLRRRARGALAFTTPNGYHSYNTDLMGGALQSLAQAYRQIISQDAAGVHVNMLLSADSSGLCLRSNLPQEGRLEVRASRSATLFVRLPGETARASVVLRVNDTPRPMDWKNGELAVGSVTPGAVIAVLFPLPKRHTRELAPGYSQAFEADWIGDTIVAMLPREGKIALY